MYDDFIKMVMRYRNQLAYREVSVSTTDEWLAAKGAIVLKELDKATNNKYDIRKFKPVSGESST